tara:strand:+ start:2777 stop:3943 length:1167 start_codon:yes stop_codon:yes gene_type:complete
VKIHEYQAKTLLAKAGLPVPKGEVAFKASEARSIAERFGGRVVVKAQIHAGGRGKGGGVQVVDGAEAAEQTAEKMLGMNLVTAQTDSTGQVVRQLLVEEAVEIAAEYYFGIVIDRERARPVVMASSAGGMEIEQVAADTPKLICKQVIDTPHGLFDFQARSLAYEIGLSGAVARQAAEVMVASQRLFVDIDASLLEINPLIVTTSGDVLILDAKMSLDDNALYRHMDLAALRDVSEEDALEVEASKYDLNYIRLDGNIGCMVNGAGLAMATMDIIKLAGGNPANFLDVGGGANTDQIRNAFRIVLADTNVKAVLINIFGGILRCDVLASGVIDAVKELDVDIPVVIRMEGTNVEDGKSILRGSGLNFTTVLTMDEAASAVVALAADSK